MPAPTHDDAAFALLHGRWDVVRRESSGDPSPMARITFGPHGVLGGVAPDGATPLRGHWEGATHGAGRAPTLHLLVGAREHVFDSVSTGRAPGSLHLVGASTTWALVRARPIAAAMIGTWVRANETYSEGHPRVYVQLHPDGSFAWHATEASTRTGRWWAEAAVALGIIPFTLDPSNASEPLLHWSFDAGSRHGHPVELHEGTTPESTWVRARTDPFAHRFEGRWRRFAPVGGDLPRELALLPGGDAELLVHASTPRWTGRWWIHHVRRHASAVEATLTVIANAEGHAPVRDVSHVRLPFAQGAPLEFLAPDGSARVAFRRLFR